MPRPVTVDCAAIRDWDTFHDAFARAFGFPGFYGRNLDAWIDCMGGLDAGMAGVGVPPGGTVLLHLANADQLKRAAPEILAALLELAGFVNWRRVEAGEPPVLIVACNA